MNNDILLEALKYAAHGYPVFPLKGKIPAIEGGFRSATIDEAVINRWWQGKYVGCNIGIPTGEASRFWVLDIDNKAPEANGLNSLRNIVAEHGELPITVTQRTGSGGQHLLFRWRDTEIRNSAGRIGPGIDVRGDGGYIVASPSIHPVTHQAYQWINGRSLFEFEIAACPPSLEQVFARPSGVSVTPQVAHPITVSPQLVSYGRHALDDECRRIECAVNGTQESTLNNAAFALGQLVAAQALGYREASDGLLASALRMPSYRDPWKPRELMEKIRHGLDDGMRYPRVIPSLSQAVSVPAQGSAEKPALVEALRELSRDHAVVIVGGKCRVLKEGLSPITGLPEIAFLRQEDFRLLFNKHKFMNGERKEGLGTIWLNNPERRDYKGIVFSPNGAPESYFNLWRGFPIESRQSDKCDRFLQHVRENIAANDEEVFAYILNFMADAIQNPASKPGVAIVLRGEQGTGKSFFAEQFGSLFGSHYAVIHNQRHLVGNFNSVLAGKLLVFADEAFWAGQKDAEGVLKGLVTAPTINIERKGIDPVEVPNFIRLIVASNNDWVVPAGPSERRFFVLDVADHHKQDHAYFSAIDEDMKNGGREALMHYLLQIDLSGVNLRKFPQTAALQEQKIHSMEPFARVYFDWLMRGYVLPDVDWEKSIWSSQLQEVFVREAGQAGFKTRSTETTLGMKLQKLVPGTIKGRSSALGRPYYYQLPPLKECREHFCKMMGMEIDWPTAADEPVAKAA